MKNKFAVVALLSFITLAGCENIRVGGLSMNKLTGLSSGNGVSNLFDYCKQNPGPCVATGILSAAALAAILSNQRDGRNCKGKKVASRSMRSLPGGCGGGGGSF